MLMSYATMESYWSLVPVVAGISLLNSKPTSIKLLTVQNNREY